MVVLSLFGSSVSLILCLSILSQCLVVQQLCVIAILCFQGLLTSWASRPGELKQNLKKNDFSKIKVNKIQYNDTTYRFLQSKKV